MTSTNQVIKIRKTKQWQLKIIIFFIPDSDCGVLKKSDEMEMSSLGLVEICIFFQQRNRFDYSLTPGSKYQKNGQYTLD